MAGALGRWGRAHQSPGPTTPICFMLAMLWISDAFSAILYSPAKPLLPCGAMAACALAAAASPLVSSTRVERSWTSDLVAQVSWPA